MNAHEIAKSKTLPEELAEVQESVVQHAVAADNAEDTARRASEKFRRAAERVGKDADTYEFLVEQAEAEEAAAELLAKKREDHGLHAYHYVQFDDGSVLAVWASHDDPGNVKFKAFDDVDAASEWTPRDER